VKKRKTKFAKEFTAKLPCFRDLLPNLEGVGPLWVSDHMVKIIVDLRP
jgi:hypothetical protein